MAIDNTTIVGLAGSERKMEIRVNAIREASNELVQSGLTATSAEVTALANGGPRKVTLDYRKPLNADVFNVSSDNINSEGSVGKMEGASYGAMRLDLNYAWGTTDLTQIVTQYGRQGDLYEGLAGYQNAVSKSLLASTLKGVRTKLAANTAITKVVNTDFDMQVIFDAVATAEEWSSLFKVMIVSHGRYAKLQGQEKNGYVPASKTETRFDTYQDFILLKSNTLTNDEVTIGRLGALGYGEGTAQQAFEVERRANAADGGGADILHSRFSRVLAPIGMDYKGAIPTTQAQVKSYLEAAASWDKVAPDAQFGFRFVKFNNA
ncbi:hypothetical protein [Sphingomonas sp. G-3-2-10]|uniref:hypothetical protein n=1 Tax=Sphingomonas sp. G-3-2-10 TaxID=2728838 RepID=UPI00146D3595|nr:hypothetical protein [Sphingomonas sp. G-3-2-10]NML04276.1 hypothetical protein [Sphingomonas sp. G-3-2-10]